MAKPAESKQSWKIGVLGTGEVGRTLATGFLGLGHSVILSAREKGNEVAKAWLAGIKQPHKASISDFADCVKNSDLLVLAVKWDGAQNALQLAGPANFRGKVVIDATNPVTMESGRFVLTIGHSDSAGERVQKWIPEAHVVKAFNSVGNAFFVNPQFGTKPTMFIAGDNQDAKAKVSALLESMGW